MIFFVALLLVSFVSLPVLSGSGDEDPWGADGEEGTTGGSSDSLVVVSSDNVFYSNIGVGADIGTFEDLVFSISFEVVYYLFGSSFDSNLQPAVSDTQIITEENTGLIGPASNSSMK
ncbi:MAG: hypothetical protein DRP35_08525 [Candidatus Zixiibacteriota bacterium]|nr:MAG: hypothetical protein DRP35_08525 [candidate division Zixibacteria bacterium]